MPTSSPTNPTPAAPPGPDRRVRWLGGVAAALAVGGLAWLGWRQLDFDRAAPDAAPKSRAPAPDDAAAVEALKRTAHSLLGADRLDDAGPVLTRWCELRPGEAEPFRLRMYQRHRLGFRGKTVAERLHLQNLALDDGLHVLELTPDDDSAAQEVVWLGLAVGRFDEVEPVCRRCLERRPGDVLLRYLQARLCHARGATAEAADLLDGILRRQPTYARGLLLRGRLYYEANEADRAVPLLRQVVEQDKDLRQEARYFLGLALARAGRADEARQVLGEVQRVNLDDVTAGGVNADSPAVKVRRAELLLGVGRGDDARAILDAVLRDDPESPAAHRLLAAYYGTRGEAQKSADHRRRAEGVTR